MRTLATLVSLLGGVALAIIFGAIGVAQAQTLDCTPNVYGGMICQGRTPGPAFNRYPALEAKTFDYGKIMRDAETLRTQRLQNQLLQQQLQQQQQQQQQQQFQATGAGVLKGDPLNADEAFIQATAAPIGKTIAWNNPNTGNYGTVTPIREGTKNTGEYCREFQQTVVIGGQQEDAYGVACRQGDGAWRIELR